LRIIRKTEIAMSPSTRHDHTRLLAGVIAQISLYLDTGCPRAARRAGLLLRCLDDDAIDQELMTSCEELDRVISQARRPDATPPHSISNLPRLRSSQTCAAGVFNSN
jgi:hypothetical protein